MSFASKVEGWAWLQVLECAQHGAEKGRPGRGSVVEVSP